MWTKTSLLLPASIQNRKNLRKKTSKSCENRLQKHQKISINTFISKKNKTFIGTYCCALVVQHYIFISKKNTKTTKILITHKKLRQGLIFYRAQRFVFCCSNYNWISYSSEPLLGQRAIRNSNRKESGCNEWKHLTDLSQDPTEDRRLLLEHFIAVQHCRYSLPGIIVFTWPRLCCLFCCSPHVQETPGQVFVAVNLNKILLEIYISRFYSHKHSLLFRSGHRKTKVGSRFIFSSV